MAWPSLTAMFAPSVTGKLQNYCFDDQPLDVTDFLELQHQFVFRGGVNFCAGNQSNGCCFVPTIRYKYR